MNRWQRDERGFTLIELMIVILVILVLAAILIPQFGLARERARKASCVSNQRNLETAVAMWQTDNPNTTLVGNTMNSSTPSFAGLTGTPNYAMSGMFVEPDTGGTPDGTAYYLSQGSATGGTAVQTAPSYGHVACAVDHFQDGWVADYDTAVNAATWDHRRGATASP